MPVFDRLGGVLRGRSTTLIFLLLLLLVAFHLRDDYTHVTPIYWQTARLKGTISNGNPGAAVWAWNDATDANNLLLTSGQCDSAFPGLFDDINRRVRKHIAPAHRITIDHLDKFLKINGFVRGMIYDQQLYIITTGGPVYSRSFAVLSQIHRALVTSPEVVPNIEFTFSVDDRLPPLPQWTFARTPDDETTWLMPDFGFWSWPETKVGAFGEVLRKSKEVDAGVGWLRKVPKLLWRGAAMGLPLRESFINATADKDWADVKALNWHPAGGAPIEGLMGMHEHCRNKYLAHTEGNSYSGRLKYLQLCKSVIVAHPMGWITHYSHLMKRNGLDQNYLEVKRDWSDLESQIRYLEDDDALAERIANNSVHTFRDRYLTHAAEVCYWRRLFKGWAEVSFEPTFYDISADGTRTWRGVPYESYILERRLEWDPY